MINSTRTHSRTRGFTLIELLVVLLVIALISSITVLSMGDSTFRKINQEAQRFQLLINSLADEAVYSGEEYGVFLTESSYQLMQFDLEGNRWLPMTDSPQQQHRLGEPIVLYWEIEGFTVEDNQPEQLRALLSDESLNDEEERILPHIMLFSSGEVTPFVVGFYADADKQSVAREVISDGFGLAQISEGS